MAEERPEQPADLIAQRAEVLRSDMHTTLANADHLLASTHHVRPWPHGRGLSPEQRELSCQLSRLAVAHAVRAHDDRSRSGCRSSAPNRRRPVTVHQGGPEDPDNLRGRVRSDVLCAAGGVGDIHAVHADLDDSGGNELPEGYARVSGSLDDAVERHGG